METEANKKLARDKRSSLVHNEVEIFYDTYTLQLMETDANENSFKRVDYKGALFLKYLFSVWNYSIFLLNFVRLKIIIISTSRNEILIQFFREPRKVSQIFLRSNFLWSFACQRLL